jgi:hypothetical protein
MELVMTAKVFIVLIGDDNDYGDDGNVVKAVTMR